MKILGDAQRVKYKQRLLEDQAEYWVQSSTIFLGRIEKSRTIKLPYETPFGDTSHKVKVRPIRWIKGRNDKRTFWLRHPHMTTCGPSGAGDAIDGDIGENFLFFGDAGGNGPRHIVHSVGLASAEEPRVKLALNAKQ